MATFTNFSNKKDLILSTKSKELNENLETHETTNSDEVTDHGHSRFIHWGLAKDLIAAYDGHPGRLMRQTEIGERKLDGFIFDVGDIKTIINQSGKNVTDLAIFIGIKEEDLLEPNPDKQTFTLIMVGKDNQNVLTDGVVVDYCEPIP